MLSTIFTSIKQEAAAWRVEAIRRREISTSDAVADTLEYCADVLEKRVVTLESDTEWLTPEQYGSSLYPRVSGQTIRNWIKRGELAAISGAHGFRVARSARRQRTLQLAS